MRFRFLCLIMLFFAVNAHAKSTGFAERPDVKKFIAHMVQKYHYNKAQLIAAFNTVKPKPSVLHSVSAPLEQKPWYTYQFAFVTETRIREGVAFWQKYQATLARAERLYGVPPEIIIATIGVETKYGKNLGKYRVIDSLSNIAFSHSSRATFFRSELEQFFLLTREQHLNPLSMMGSYAGAIGQPQFMPSSYRHYAVDFSGHKKIDLIHNEADIIGSIANYYHQHGWSYRAPVALKTTLSGSGYEWMSQREQANLIGQFDLNKYGLEDYQHQKIRLIPLKKYIGYEYWLGFHNFEVIKRYNPSNLYAMAVFQLGYYISQLKEGQLKTM